MYLVLLEMVFQSEKTEAGETALLVGGGIGVPPLYELSKRLDEKGVNANSCTWIPIKRCCVLRREISSSLVKHIL